MLKSIATFTSPLLLMASVAFAQPRPMVDGDADGVPDEIDLCPYTLPGTAVDSTGCPLQVNARGADADGDGVPDERDDCPYTPPGARVDAHGCAIDSDFDGVPDGIDQCPATPYGEGVDARGCAPRETPGLRAISPAAATAKSPQPSAAIVPPPVSIPSTPSAANGCEPLISPNAPQPMSAPSPPIKPQPALASPASIPPIATPQASAIPVPPAAQPAAPMFNQRRSIPAPSVIVVPGATPLISNSAPTVAVPFPRPQNPP